MSDDPFTPCTRWDGCEADASHWSETPCGRRNSVMCPHCGFPAPCETDDNYGSPCPHGWRVPTIADIKAFAAEEGFDTELRLAGNNRPAADSGGGS